MADLVDALFEQPEPATPEPVVETPTPPEVKQETPPAPTPELIAPQEEKSVPLPTFLDMRDRQKEADRRAEAAERRAQELEARFNKPGDIPDPIDDPTGFTAAQDAKFDARLSEMRFEMSDQLARGAHGAETVDSAVQWAQEKAKADPVFAASYMREKHPIDWIVRQHKRDAMLTDIGDNMDDWFTREAAKRGYAPQPAPNVVVPAAMPTIPAQPAQRPVPPRSIASDATTSGAPTTQPGNWMEGFIR